MPYYTRAVHPLWHSRARFPAPPRPHTRTPPCRPSVGWAKPASSPIGSHFAAPRLTAHNASLNAPLWPHVTVRRHHPRVRRSASASTHALSPLPVCARPQSGQAPRARRSCRRDSSGQRATGERGSPLLFGDGRAMQAGGTPSRLLPRRSPVRAHSLPPPRPTVPSGEHAPCSAATCCMPHTCSCSCYLPHTALLNQFCSIMTKVCNCTKDTRRTS